MTNKEAIRWIQLIKDTYTHSRNKIDTMSGGALDMAVAALRAQAEAEKNAPFTIEELKVLESWGPIWIHRSNGASRYYIAQNIGTGLDLYRGGCVYESFGDYGKTWLAYRQKPEE